jgi:small subunit ribosomal protein S3
LRELYQAIQDSQIKVDLELVRIKNPYTNAQLVSNMVAEQLEKRVKMRQILNFFVGKILVEPEVRGVRITAEGCLNGAKKTQKKEIARGGMPLNTIDIRIERGEETAIITKGVIGIEVLIYKGKIWTK